MLSLRQVFSCSQGMTIKPLVELLDVKRKKRALPTISEEIHSRVNTSHTLSQWYISLHINLVVRKTNVGKVFQCILYKTSSF